MKAKIILLAMACFMTFCVQKNLNAQGYNTGSFNFSLGYGLVPTWGVFKSKSPDWKYVPGDSYPKSTGPFYIKAEVAVTKHIFVGMNFSYLYDRWYLNNTSLETDTGTIIFNENRHRTSWSLLLHANWHFGPFKRFDPYVGFGIGYRRSQIEGVKNEPVNKSEVIYSNPYHFGCEVTIGTRFYLNPYSAIYAETGLSKSIFQIGLVINVPNNKYNNDIWHFPKNNKHKHSSSPEFSL
jgi:outer membrane protein W